MEPAQTQTPPTQFTDLRTQLMHSTLPHDLVEKLIGQLDRLDHLIQTEGYTLQFDKEIEYIKFVVSLPFDRSSQDILDLHRAIQILDKDHFGLKLVKDRILEYLSVLILNQRQGHAVRAPILTFLGLVGTGKTSLAYSIAESLGRKIIRIPFGGLGTVAQLRGQSRVRNEAEPGQIIKRIRECGVNNPIILLDEVDRVSSEARADVMGVLVELLDPEQNFAFVDHYVDYPFDLSKVMFIATANNTTNIATAVLDRMEVIEMPAYSDEEKIMIAKNYVLPKLLDQSGLPRNLIQVDDTVWPQLVRPLGFDGGIRSLQRNLQGMVRKIARQVVEGQPGPFVLNSNTVKLYLE
jgi:ATP-dependent Lon protease